MVNGEIKWPDWETVGLIGRGSFGAVYEIRRDVLGETERAALKVISIPQSSNDIEEMYSDGYDDESITATFKEHLKSIVAEYSLMRKMGDCVNIVKCDDVRYIQHDNGIGWDIFIKMELLMPLTKALPDVIPEEMVIKLAKDMCTALDACKKHGVIHRDIKPQNIFVSESGDYKLGDFGIAKTVERTASGTKIGTYKYMAPEVYNNQPYGSAADIYSLGLVLYWMLNDRRMPFLPLASQMVTVGAEEKARVRRFSGEPISAPAHGSADLQAIVLKACAFNPADRYRTPQEMLADLQTLTEPEVIPEEPEVIPEEPEVIPEEPEPAHLVEEPRRENFEQEPQFSKKKKIVALILAVIPYTGLFGIHDFYLGKPISGVLKIITANYFIFGWVWDIVAISRGKYKDGNGKYLKHET